MARVLALFAKAPIAGQVKTRLLPSLTPEQAARLYEAMLLDVADLHAHESGCDLALWFSPPEAEPWFRSHMPSRYRRLPQRGEGLGARMAALFEQHHGEGYTRMVLRGTDSPTLPPARIGEAFDALAHVDLVLGPDLDGGYGLIGLRRPCPALFEIPMSTDSVLRSTLERAEREGLRHALLEPHHDVDTLEDLARLRADARIAPRTSAWLLKNPPTPA